MKPQIGITLIVLILLGVFTIYSNLPQPVDRQSGAIQAEGLGEMSLEPSSQPL